MARKKNNRKGEIEMTNEEIKNEEQVVTEEVIQPVSNEGEENVTVDNNVNEDAVQEPNPEDPEVKPEEVEPTEDPEVKPEEAKPAENEPVDGVVEGCVRLNVRKEANKTADVVRVINKGDSVMVDLEKSTEDFYKIFTLDFDGYCVKDFIKIK